MNETWEPTMNLRIHRQIHRYEWTNTWTPRYTQTFQQEWKCLETGLTKWEPFKIVTEEDDNVMHYG